MIKNVSKFKNIIFKEIKERQKNNIPPLALNIDQVNDLCSIIKNIFMFSKYSCIIFLY